MRHKSDINKKRLLEELEKSLGNVTIACRNMGISRDFYYDWIKKDAEFKEKANAVNEVAGDYVENKLFELIKEKNTAAIIFYCKTKLKNRGYIERTEITGKDGKDIYEVPYIDLNGIYHKQRVTIKQTAN